jgi:hypothetical protein
MTIAAFIRANREEIDRIIDRAVCFVPASASCDCPRSRTAHYCKGPQGRTDAERRLWVLNDQGLYSWARSEGVRI